MPWYCPVCTKRTKWCHWCRVRHCACRPHVSRSAKYVGKVHTIRLEAGGTRLMSARRYAHLKGAQKGGRATALRSNPGRFTPDSARKAALARWQGRHRVNRHVGLRLGLRRKRSRPEVSRRHLRYLYARVSRLGIAYDLGSKRWTQVVERFPGEPDYIRSLSEDTALRLLGHLPARRQNWVPGESDQIIATTVGIVTARKKRRGGWQA